MSESRSRYLELCLSHLPLEDRQLALKAFDFVKAEMCAEKGFTRDSGEHYYYHCIDVTQILYDYGFTDGVTLSATLLHDTVEDLDGVTVEMIRRMFGDEVARTVSLLTKRKDVDYKVNNFRAFKEDLEVILEDWRAAVIKTADRIHNFGTLDGVTAEKKMRKALETKEVFLPFWKQCRKKYVRYSSFFHMAKRSIAPHLKEIEDHFDEVQLLKQEIEELKKQLQQTAI